MDRTAEVRVLLFCVACALLVLVVLAANVARLGSAISREVERVQLDYMQHMGDDASARAHALLLGQCLRREMLKSARAGIVEPESWAMTARIRALPRCADGLPRTPSRPALPIVPNVRMLPIVALAPSRAAAALPRHCDRPETHAAAA